MKQFMQNSLEELLGYLRVKGCRCVFTNTLQQILNGKVYKKKCNGNLYTYR